MRPRLSTFQGGKSPRSSMNSVPYARAPNATERSSKDSSDGSRKRWGCSMAELLRAPFPYAGGKGKKDVTALAWQAMGVDVPTYIEATTGSAAMLLARPGGAGKYEVINDANGLIVNVWRAIKAEPDLVAEMVQQPPSELELAARSRMLRGAHEFIDLMKDNIEWFDVACAAYWVWCQCVSFSPD